MQRGNKTRGVTPLHGLNGDVRPDRVWFSEDFVLNGVLISSIFVLNRVSYKTLCIQKPNIYQFANVQHIEMRNSLWLVHSSRKEGMMLS